MSTVTVDVDDLEKLVFATGVIKTIEGALAAFKNDLFVAPYLPITDAHNRLATEVRNSKRVAAGTAIGWDDPLTLEEASLLDQIKLVCEEKDYATFTPEARLKNKAVDSLMCKGCAVLGQPLKGIKWADSERPQLIASSEFFAVKITPRGIAKLAEALRQKVA
jgi:hypothetical protein